MKYKKPNKAMEKVRPETGREAGLDHGRERPPLATIFIQHQMYPTSFRLSYIPLFALMIVSLV